LVLGVDNIFWGVDFCLLRIDGARAMQQSRANADSSASLRNDNQKGGRNGECCDFRAAVWILWIRGDGRRAVALARDTPLFAVRLRRMGHPANADSFASLGNDNQKGGRNGECCDFRAAVWILWISGDGRRAVALALDTPPFAVRVAKGGAPGKCGFLRFAAE
jgi:hypothetical protein